MRAVELPDLTGLRRPQARARVAGPDIRSGIKAGPDRHAEVFLYDEIGFWGVMAAELVPELAALDVDKITLRVNSPGGDVFDGLAIYNALVNHAAEITVKIEGLAASAASFIAMAGEEIVMEPQAQMMIHDAWGVCMGMSADMHAMGEILDGISGGIADIYTERAGGDVADWRAAMLAESWYSADEAVDAGLATSVRGRKADTKADFDLSIFTYAGRDKAPGPAMIKSQHADIPALDHAALAAALRGATR